MKQQSLPRRAAICGFVCTIALCSAWVSDPADSDLARRGSPDPVETADRRSPLLAQSKAPDSPRGPQSIPGPKPVAKPPSALLAFDPIEQYSERQIEGWKVVVNQRLFAKPHDELREATLKLLQDHLYRITRAVPEPALGKLRQVHIWVELADPRHPCMCYHPEAGWLKEHGMNPQKAGCVELSNCKNFLSWTHEQPWMVFHELAHAYHHQSLKFENAEVRACFERAKAAKIYNSILHWDGNKVRHYALTNEMEYFAETSEAYFGHNDYFPFVRAELKHHDPAGYDLMEKTWGVKKPGK